MKEYDLDLRNQNCSTVPVLTLKNLLNTNYVRSVL